MRRQNGKHSCTVPRRTRSRDEDPLYVQQIGQFVKSKNNVATVRPNVTVTITTRIMRDATIFLCRLCRGCNTFPYSRRLALFPSSGILHSWISKRGFVALDEACMRRQFGVTWKNLLQVLLVLLRRAQNFRINIDKSVSMTNWASVKGGQSGASQELQNKSKETLKR